MVFKLIIAVAGLIGFYWLSKLKSDKPSMVITLIISISILCIFIPIEIIRMVGMFGLPISSVLVIAYGLLKKDLTKGQRRVSLIISVLVLASQLSMFLNSSYAYWFGIIMIIPLISYVIILFKGISKFRNQFGFLTIMASYALSRFVVHIQNGL